MTLEKTCDELGLSVRTYNCLKRTGINTLTDILNELDKGLSNFMRIMRIAGRKSLEEVLKTAQASGYPADEIVDKYIVDLRKDPQISIEVIRRWENLRDSLNGIESTTIKEYKESKPNDSVEQNEIPSYMPPEYYYHSDYYVVCKNDTCMIETGDPYIEFINKTLGYRAYTEISTSSYFFEDREKATEEVLDTLASCEADTIKNLFGLFGCKIHTPEQLIAEYQLSNEEWQEFIERIYRKLRHPSRTRKILRNKCELRYRSYALGNAYIRDMQLKFRDEIKELISGNNKNSVYLKRVLQKNKIELETTYLKKEIGINEVELSPRALTCLHKAEISTLNELADMSEYALKVKFGCYGEKFIDEIFSKLLEIKKHIVQYHSVSVVKNGEKVVYKFFDNNLDKVTDEVYREIENNRPTVFSAEYFSPDLCEILLLKGYLFVDSIIEESEQLKNEMIDFGFPEYAQEIEAVVEFYKLQNEENGIAIYLLPHSITAEEIHRIEACNTKDEVFSYIDNLYSRNQE